MLETIKNTANFIKEKTNFSPEIGIILGTGLGGLVNEIETEHVIPYEEIPDFPVSTVEGHSGKLIFGSLGGKKVIALQGRFHFYEGYSMSEVVFPVRVMKYLGIEKLIVSNACGGLNPYFNAGDLMVIEDQINLLGDNPLIGINDDRLGPRFPDMCEPYDQQWIDRTMKIARERDINIHKGVFVAVAGPNLETRAEYRYLRMIGADVVGMSTVPEAIVAVHCGLKTVGLSVVTDMCLPDALKPSNVEEIIAVANEATPKLIAVVDGIVQEFNHTRMA